MNRTLFLISRLKASLLAMNAVASNLRSLPLVFLLGCFRIGLVGKTTDIFFTTELVGIPPASWKR